MSAELPEPAIEKPDETPIMIPPAPDMDETKKKEKKEFWFGFGLWFALNIFMGLCTWGVQYAAISVTGALDGANPGMNDAVTAISGLISFVPFVVNVGLLIYFAVTKRAQTAMGMLAAFSSMLMLSLVLGLLTSVGCFVAFTTGASSEANGYVIVGQIIVAAVMTPIAIAALVMAAIFFAHHRSSRSAYSLRMTKVLGITVGVIFLLGVCLTVAYFASNAASLF